MPSGQPLVLFGGFCCFVCLFFLFQEHSSKGEVWNCFLGWHPGRCASPRYPPARRGGRGHVPAPGAVTVVTGGRRDPRLTREMDGGAGFPQLVISPCSGKAERFLPGKLCAIPQKSGLNKWG